MSKSLRANLPFDSSKGACREHGVLVFYPIVEKPTMSTKMRALIQEAKKICSTCEVREPCLKYALENESHGIWGGLSETERQYRRLELGIVYKPWETGNGTEVESTNAIRARRRWRDAERKRQERERKAKQRDKQNPNRKKRRSNVKSDVIIRDETIKSE